MLVVLRGEGEANWRYGSIWGGKGSKKSDVFNWNDDFVPKKILHEIFFKKCGGGG